MSRMTDNDKNWGPFTVGPWSKTFSLRISSGNRWDEDDEPSNFATVIGFGWALRIKLPPIIPPVKPKGDYQFHPREYGMTLSDMGNGYDFLQILLGAQTHSSDTTQSWCKHLPWKQWRHIRTSVYDPEGGHFATEEKGKWREFSDLREKCQASYFGFEDYDGEMIVATCRIEEREWKRGEGWFKWLSWFYPKMIRRELSLSFNAEVGPGKGSWKGGTIGTGIDMRKEDYPINAFKRYCDQGYNRKGRTTPLRFIGPCKAPEKKAKVAT